MEKRSIDPAFRILFVDDNIKLLKSLERHFKKRFSLDTATSGAEGLELLSAKAPYAVIVSDYRMPDMDGTEFLAHAKKLAVESIRILFTGHADLGVAIRAVNEGEIFRFVSKPCNLDQLAEVITTAIEKYRLHTIGNRRDKAKPDFTANNRIMLTLDEIAGLLGRNPDSENT